MTFTSRPTFESRNGGRAPFDGAARDRKHSCSASRPVFSVTTRAAHSEALIVGGADCEPVITFSASRLLLIAALSFR
jgi:hypothetical protein